MINWARIETVLLDMDGTLLDLHFDNYFWLEYVPLRYAEQNQLPQKQAVDRLMSQFNAHRGTLNWYCLDFWSDQLQMDIGSLKREVTHKIAFRPQVKEFLRQLQTAGKHSVIVTNAHRHSLQIKLDHTDLADRVDRVICAHDLSLPKENSRFWPALQSELPFEKASTLLIDDSLPVLNSARSYGIQHLLSIAKPDSQQPPRQIEGFDAVHDFMDISPGNPQA